MRNPKDDRPEDEEEGGKAAERLKDLLRRKLPPGASPEELNPEEAENEPDSESGDDQGSKP